MIPASPLRAIPCVWNHLKPLNDARTQAHLLASSMSHRLENRSANTDSNCLATREDDSITIQSEGFKNRLWLQIFVISIDHVGNMNRYTEPSGAIVLFLSERMIVMLQASLF
jgi:hypothetical protein